MRQSHIAGIVAGALVLSSVTALPGAAAQTPQGSDARVSALDPNPNDPLKLPEDNVLDKVSSSEMFLEWTDGMEAGTGRDVVRSWAANSSVPQTANPVELLKQEVQGSAQMSSGLFTGDFALSSGGSSKSASVVLTVLVGWLVLGSLVELIMRGARMAGL